MFYFQNLQLLHDIILIINNHTAFINQTKRRKMFVIQLGTI